MNIQLRRLIGFYLNTTPNLNISQMQSSELESNAEIEKSPLIFLPSIKDGKVLRSYEMVNWFFLGGVVSPVLVWLASSNKGIPEPSVDQNDQHADSD
ncbi:hypothetical protein ACS0TY_002878 [Phlomoides rotata]